MSILGLKRLVLRADGNFQIAPDDSTGGYYVVHPNAEMPGELIVAPKSGCTEQARDLLRWCTFDFGGNVRCSDGVMGTITKSQVLDLLPHLAPPGAELRLLGLDQTFHNPADYHIAERFPLEETLARVGKGLPPDFDRPLPEEEILIGPDDSTPGKPYSSQAARQLKSINEHKGQYKLLLSECDLVNFLDPDKFTLFIYPGGGPGHHVPLMAARHPEVMFVLIDPVFVKPDIVPPANVIIIPTLFDPEPFYGYSDLGRDDWQIVMVSDIRSEPRKPDGRPFPQAERKTPAYAELFEREVYDNMMLQRRWVLDVKPEVSMLKFRLNFHRKGSTRYFRGIRRFQVWAPAESAELRLIVQRQPDGSYPEVDYDHETYERQMFWFNSVYRPSVISSHPFTNYDLYRSADIIAKYLGVSTVAEVAAFMLMMDEFFVSQHDRQDANFRKVFRLAAPPGPGGKPRPGATAPRKGEGKRFVSRR